MESEPPKAEPPKRGRRWYQFSLRTLLIVVTLLAIPCAYLSWQAKIVAERRRLLHVLAKGGGCYSVPTDRGIAFFVGSIPENGEFYLQIQTKMSENERHSQRPLKLRRWLGDLPIEQIWISRRLVASQDADYIASCFPEAGITLIPGR